MDYRTSSQICDIRIMAAIMTSRNLRNWNFDFSSLTFASLEVLMKGDKKWSYTFLVTLLCCLATEVSSCTGHFVIRFRNFVLSIVISQLVIFPFANRYPQFTIRHSQFRFSGHSFVIRFANDMLRSRSAC